MSVLRRKKQMRILLPGLPQSRSPRKRNPPARVPSLPRRAPRRRKDQKAHPRNQLSPDLPQSSSLLQHRNGILSSRRSQLPKTSPRPPQHKPLYSFRKQHLCTALTFRITPLLGFLRALLRTTSSCRKSYSPEHCPIG